MPTPFVIKDDRGYFGWWDVEFPLPPIELPNVIDAAFGVESIGIVHT
jgi:hypothetical protein